MFDSKTNQEVAGSFVEHENGKINVSLFSSWNTNISNSLLLPWDSIVSFNTLPNSNKFMMLLIVFVTFVCICTSKTELTCQIKSPGHIFLLVLCIISIFFCHFILTYCSKITRWKIKSEKNITAFMISIYCGVFRCMTSQQIGSSRGSITWVSYMNSTVQST